MLKFMGADAYRLGISWSRLFPEGSGTVNQEALDFYNKFIDLLIQNGITPFVTLFHFNVPVALQKKYDGFLSDNIVADYANFADTCFKNFGDRVKHWVTFNEPQVWSVYGYKTKMTAKDDPTRNPYIVAHNIIVSHATVVKNYRENYQGSQGGEIGMSLSTQWNMPYENSPEHIDACGRAWDFHFGWFAEPMIAGDYPFIMKALVRDRLRAFTTEEKELIKGSCDFIGINYYTSRFAQALPIDTTVDVPTSYDKDQYLNALSTNSSGESIGPTSSGSSQINVYPAGIRDVLRHTKNHYKSPKIYITENGYPTARNDKNPTWKELEDDDRIEFIESHLRNVRDAQRIDGVDVNGYLVWALMDNVEWGSGYNVRFGLSFIDYNNDLMRYPKKSAKWLRDFNMEDKETNGSVTSTTTSTE
ncbi:Glycoside hydrolase [Macleaya cordata]|uniref:Glycoside hydrolase n=1 Tax=Macleaya cordata TaxID=56857 RepID=A0A200QY64_MACCD|nr:Glycoside hydrolase [Macleaya cordata]